MLYEVLKGQQMGNGDSSFVVAEWSEGPCPADGICEIAPYHLHRECDEAWVVLDGRLAFRIDGEVSTVAKGGAMFVPRGKAHTFWNPDSEPVRYLLIMTPKIARLIDAIHTSEDRSWARLETLFEEFDAELLG